MNAPRWMATPLAGTAGVLAGLCLLAVPLRKLTSATPVAAVKVAAAVVSAGEIPTVLRLKLLAPAKRLVVKNADGGILMEMSNAAAGESEHDTAVRFTDGELALTLEADFGSAGADTAVFLTVMPDGCEDQTRYAIGGGHLVETLRYAWPAH